MTSFISFQSVDTQTIPPPRSNYGANTLQWNIYDWYANDFEQQQKEKDKEKKEKYAPKKEVKKKSEKSQATEQLTKRYLKCWQILERMINQNIYDDIAQGSRTFGIFYFTYKILKYISVFLQTIAITKTHQTTIAKKREHYCLSGVFSMKNPRNFVLPIYVLTRVIMIYLPCALDHVCEYF